MIRVGGDPPIIHIAPANELHQELTYFVKCCLIACAVSIYISVVGGIGAFSPQSMPSLTPIFEAISYPGCLAIFISGIVLAVLSLIVLCCGSVYMMINELQGEMLRRNAGPPRANRHLDALTYSPVPGSETLACGICLEDLKEGAKVKGHDTHLFCELCLDRWIARLQSEGKEATCPICRANFFS